MYFISVCVFNNFSEFDYLYYKQWMSFQCVTYLWSLIITITILRANNYTFCFYTISFYAHNLHIYAYIKT